MLESIESSLVFIVDISLVLVDTLDDNGDDEPSILSTQIMVC